ncbi:peptidase M50 [Nitrospira sp.]|nr:peptidase M50 [Nitrospira sp.]
MIGKQVTLFEVLGFKIQLDFSWIFLALLVTWSLAIGYFPAYYLGLETSTYWWMGAVGAVGLFGSLIFHELAHSLVARRYGLPIRSITLFIFGGVAQMDEEPPNPKTELLMAAAGPISSFVLSAAFYATFDLAYRVQAPLSWLGIVGYLAFVNLLLGAFNLLPAFPLDGGRVLRAALWYWKKDLREATRSASRIGSISGMLLMFSGIFHILMANFVTGVWWFVMGLFLRGAARASYYQTIARTALGGTPIRNFMTPNPVTVAEDLSIAALVEEHFYRSHHDLYPVMRDSHLVGLITPKQVATVPKDQWMRLTVAELTLPLTADNTIDVDTDALAALTIMNRTGSSRLLITEGERLVGIVALKDLLKLLSLKLELEDRR